LQAPNPLGSFSLPLPQPSPYTYPTIPKQKKERKTEGEENATLYGIREEGEEM
jgi:hypothetical protein